MKVIGLVNQKGGVGKTTLSICVASGLKKIGKNVCLIDTDPQGSLRDWNSVAKEQEMGSSYAVYSADIKGLSELVKELEKDFDYIVIDGAPRSDRMASVIIRESDFILIPVAPSGLDAWASGDIVEPLEVIRSKNHGKPHARFVLNKVREGTVLKNEIQESLAEYGIPILPSMCNQREAYAQTISEGKTIFDSKNIEAKKEVSSVLQDILGVLDGD